jgi:AraC family transcriptional regulator
MSLAEAFVVPASTRFRKHAHDSPHVCVVLDGGFVEREKKSWRDVAPGTVRISGAASHDIDFSPVGATCLVLEHDISGIAPADVRFIESDPRLFSLALRLRGSGGDDDPAARIAQDDLSTELLAQIDRHLRGRTAPPPLWLDRIREMIHDSGGLASVADLAREAGVHRVHVARTFRDHYGMPVTSYARKVRVKAALTLLASSTHSLSRVALETGYADQAHFTREVRAAVGATPGKLRARLTSTAPPRTAAHQHPAPGSR